MNEFLKNLRVTQKDRVHGSARGTYDPAYPHPDRRTGADRRSGGLQRRSSHQVTEEALQGIGEVLLGIQSLLQGMGEAAQRMAEARERLADLEERKLALMESILPACRRFVETMEGHGTGGYEGDGTMHAPEGPRMVRRISREERKKIVELIRAMRQEGATYDQISEHLEKNRIPTFSNKGKWHAQTIHRLCRIP